MAQCAPTRSFSSHATYEVILQGQLAAGFAVPSYMASEEKLAGFDIKFVAPKTAWITPEPMGILAGAKHPKAAKAFVEFLL